jgi:hypothetical protein
MTVEDRLTLLLAQARESGGDAVFRDMAALRSQLSTKAPDLHGEIQALTASLAGGVPARIASSADPAGARAAAAAEIAERERLPIAVVLPALDVACRAAPGIVSPPPPADEWAGDSIAFGSNAAAAPASPPPHPGLYPPPPVYPAGFPTPHLNPHYPPPREPDAWNSYDMSGRPQPFYRKVWFFILVGLVIVGGAVLYTQWTHLFGRTAIAGSSPAAPPAARSDAPPAPPAPPPAEALFSTGGPMLSAAEDGPVLALQQAPDGRRGLSFSVTAEDRLIEGALVLPAGGWDGEATLIGATADGSRSVGTGRFELSATDRPVRLMQVQWRQDGVAAGSTAVAIVGQPGQSDVSTSGATFCLLDGTTGEPIACGQIG